MRASVATVVEINRVAAIQVGPVANEWGFGIPQGPGVPARGESEVIGVLSEAVQIRLLRQAGPEPNVLVLEVQRRIRCVEQDFAARSPCNVEGKGILGKVELESGAIRSGVLGVGPRQNVFLDLINSSFGVLD